MTSRLFFRVRAGIGPRVFVCADPVDDCIFLQQLASGDGVGLGAFPDSQVVRRAVGQRPNRGSGVAVDPDRANGRQRSRDFGNSDGRGSGELRAVSGRTLLTGMTTAPIVMPEVITGLSLLLMFVALEQLIGWPKGSARSRSRCRTSRFCMAYVTVVVQSRLVGFDESLEEAAMDLGARPATVFFRVTLPLDCAGDSVRLVAGVHAVVGRSGHHTVRRRPRLEHTADGHFLESAPRCEP